MSLPNGVGPSAGVPPFHFASGPVGMTPNMHHMAVNCPPVLPCAAAANPALSVPPTAPALLHIATAGTVAGSAEEARRNRELAMREPTHTNGSFQRDARGCSSRGSERDGIRLDAQGWTGDSSDVAYTRSQRGRGDWRHSGRGAPSRRSGAVSGRSRVTREKAAPVTNNRHEYMKASRVNELPNGGFARRPSRSDSELSLMSVACDEDDRNSVDGFTPPQSAATSLDNESAQRRGPPAGEECGGLTALSSVSPASSVCSTLSRKSSLSEDCSNPTSEHFTQADVTSSRGPLTGCSGSTSVSNVSVGTGGLTSQSPPPVNEGGNKRDGVAVRNSQKCPEKSSPKWDGNFLFDLWVPTTFHPAGKPAVKAVIGFRGATHKEMERITGAHVRVYGKQMYRCTKKHEYDDFRDNQPLHLVVTGDRVRNPNPSPAEQMQIVHRLQSMLEGLVRENWPPSATHQPHSFYDKQHCLGPSTGTLVEVDPLDGTCRVAADSSSLHKPDSHMKGEPSASNGDATGSAALQAANWQEAQVSSQNSNRKLLPQQSSTSGHVEPIAPHGTPPVEEHISSHVQGVSTSTSASGYQPQSKDHLIFTGDPDALLHLSPSMCLIMITLQGLHALLAEEGPCNTAALPKRFHERWEVPLLFMMCEYHLDSKSSLSWDDTLAGFMSNFPELYRLKSTRNEQLGETTITVEGVEAPGFHAVAERLRRFGTK